MSDATCLICGGTGITADGKPCPNCSSVEAKTAPIVAGIPAQYQGVGFDKSFLPTNMQGEYGEFMEDLANSIINDLPFYQKNMIICSRPNSGKTIWAYSLYAKMIAKGYPTPPLMDIVEARNAMNSYDDKDLSRLLSTSRCAIIKIPRDMQFWMFDSMSYIIERRVRSNGFTIFLFGGTVEDLNMLDKNKVLSYLRGSGSYNTVKVESF